jgi:hypothetical protein
MSARSFRSVFMVGAIASAALGCYLVSLRVASERAQLESVENKIALAQRDIRLIETEIGTRGRLAQLERWNVKVIRLSAPSADQFVEGAFQLATLAKPERTPAIEAPVVLASAPIAPRAEPVVTSDAADAPTPRASRPLGQMMHVASYSPPAAEELRAAPRREAPIVAKLEAKVAGETKGAKKVEQDTAKLAPKKSAAATKPLKTATVDALAPLSGAAAGGKSGAGDAKRTAAKRTPKDSGSH